MAQLDDTCIISAFQKFGFFKDWKNRCIDDNTLLNIKDNIFGFKDRTLQQFTDIMPSTIRDWYTANPVISPRLRNSDDRIDGDLAQRFENIIDMYKKPLAPVTCLLFEDQIHDVLKRFGYFFNHMINPHKKLAVYVGQFENIHWETVRKQYNQKDVRYLSFALGSGAHWTCMFFDKTKPVYEYYDSKADRLPNRYKNIINNYLPNKVWIEHTKVTQADSVSCGMYPIVYIFYRTFLRQPANAIINTELFNDQNVKEFFKLFVNIEENKNVVQGLGREAYGFETKEDDIPWYERRCIKECDQNILNQILGTTKLKDVDDVTKTSILGLCCNETYST